MDKHVYNAVSNRADGYCENCHRYGGEALELHHILRRRVKETVDNCIMLCQGCHRGTDGVHGKNGHELDLDLKINLQHKYFKQGLHEGEIRKLMADRLYSRR